jgi:hypothetical protein
MVITSNRGHTHTLFSAFVGTAISLKHGARRQYYTTISIGNPPRPYFLDVDTGSDLTWIQCDVPCSNRAEVHAPFSDTNTSCAKMLLATGTDTLLQLLRFIELN